MTPALCLSLLSTAPCPLVPLSLEPQMLTAKIEPLVATDVGGDQACSAAGDVCVALQTSAQAPALLVYRGHRGSPERLRATIGLLPDDEGNRSAGWPHLIRLSDKSILVGVERFSFSGYAGGGGQSSELTLYRLPAESGALAPAITLPWSGSISIRACFRKEDVRRRHASCEDRYRFRGTLQAGAALTFVTKAETFPGRVSRNEDSLRKPPLHRSDLVWAVDRRCTYRRTLRFDAAGTALTYDTPPPDCSDYTSP